ncbi:MAG: DUF58 domain-containing protein [bacterium]
MHSLSLSLRHRARHFLNWRNLWESLLETAHRVWFFFGGRRLTLEGYLFVGLTLVIGFAAVNTGTNLLYLILAMMLSFILVSGIVARQGIRGLSIQRFVPGYVFAGQPATIRFQITNHKRFAHSFSLRITDRLKNGTVVGVCYIVKVAKGSSTTAEYRCIFPRRGRYWIHSFTLSTRFPFGFFEQAYSRFHSRELLVYPPMVPLGDVLEKPSLNLGESESAQKGFGSSLYGLRDYRPDDSARWIHWKLSAKTSKLIVREFEREEKKKITLLLDNRLSGDIRAEVEADFERAIIVAASLARDLLHDGYQVQLVTASGSIPFDTGSQHLMRILRALALLDLEDAGAPMHGFFAADSDSRNYFLHYHGEADLVSLGSNFHLVDLRGWKLPSPEPENKKNRRWEQKASL